MQLTVNQRFALFLNSQKISQTDFADRVGMKSQTISNISTGAVLNPKSDFFEALLRFYPELNLRWLLLGEEPMLLSEAMENTHTLREPDAPSPYGKDEVQRLLKTVQQLSESLASMAKLVNDVPALREEVERLKQEVKDLKGGEK